jgi:competence protein ComEC
VTAVRRSPGEPAGHRWVWVDLRLAPAAAAIWTVCALSPLASPGQLAGIATGSAGLALIVTRRRGGAAAAVALVLLAGVAVAATAGAVRGAARNQSPLAAVADAGRSADVVLRVDADPRTIRGPGGPRVIADATVLEVLDGQVMRDLHAAVLLFAPAQGWAELLPGQHVRVRVMVSRPRAGDDVVAVVSARGPPELLGRPGAVQRAAGAVRDGLSAAAARVLDPRTAGLLPGLVVGDTAAMDPVLTEDFRRAGLAHLTAVSGDTAACQG